MLLLVVAGFYFDRKNVTVARQCARADIVCLGCGYFTSDIGFLYDSHIGHCQAWAGSQGPVLYLNAKKGGKAKLVSMYAG